MECQLQPLRRCPHSEKLLNKCLGSLPKSLYETYERILCNIESPEEARQLLSLLCFASRPLSVDEIIEALAVDIDGLGRYDPASRFNDGADDLARICPGFIEIVLEDDEPNVWVADWSDEAEYAPWSKRHKKAKSGSRWIVRIAHYSVQEYLLSDAIATSRASNFALSAPSQHGRLSKVCLLYLKNSDFQQRHDIYDLGQHAFARYAVDNWYHHHQQADGRSAQQLAGPIVTLLTTAHMSMDWLLRYHSAAEFRFRAEPPTLSAIYYASLLGLHFALAELLTLPVAMVLEPGFQSDNPLKGALQAASLNGHKATVEMLLENNVNINEDGMDDTALIAASARGHIEVVQVLLQNGPDINAQGETYDTALIAASAKGHIKVVQVLLQNGANPNAQGERYGSAPIAASDDGNVSMVRMLLNHGAEVSQTGNSGRTALEAAAAGGRIEVVKILLDKVIEVDSTGSGLCPAICEAFVNGQTEVVEMLFDHARHIHLPKLVQLFIGRSEKCYHFHEHYWIIWTIIDLSENWCSSAAQMAEAGDHEGLLRMMQERMRQHECLLGVLGGAMASEWDLGSSSFNHETIPG